MSTIFEKSLNDIMINDFKLLEIFQRVSMLNSIEPIKLFHLQKYAKQPEFNGTMAQYQQIFL